MTLNQESSSIQHNGPASVSRTSWTSARSRTSAYSTPTKQPMPLVVKKRLPLPKNVVLLSLIEATKLISGDAQSPLKLRQSMDALSTQENLGTTTSYSENDDEDSDDGDNSEEENQHAQFATSISAGIAGTYAVAVQEGLQIFPTRPASLTRSTSSTTDEDVDTLVQFFHLDKRTKGTKNQSMHNTSQDSMNGGCSSLPKNTAEMATLAYGDRIQVVSMERGWAKLARGYGFVRAEKNQIIKVMNAVDTACILEAMLRTLSQRRRHLRIKQGENDTHFIKLMNQLRSSLQSDEDFTVICRTAFAEEETTSNEAATNNNVPTNDNVPDESITQQQEQQKPIFQKEQDRPSGWQLFRCGTSKSAIIPPLTENRQNAQNNNSLSTPTNQLPSPSPNVMRAGALAWRERQAREVQKSINFRSGLSDHMALASNRAHPHDFLGVSPGEKKHHSRIATTNSGASSLRVTNFRMSSHSGLTMSSRKKQPSLQNRTQNMDNLKLAGSM